MSAEVGSSPDARAKSCCFSGHRPKKLSFGENEGHPDCVALKRVLKKEIRRLVDCGVDTFYCGMSRGVDIWCAEAVLELNDELPDARLRLVAVIPFKGQADGWGARDKARYARILYRADETVVLQEQYYNGCLLARNRYMVGNSAQLVAVYNGSPGGTRYTIEYARANGLGITIIGQNA